MRVFLGGTTMETKWREEIIPRLAIDYFNPVVKDWTPEFQEIERQEKDKCDILLYVVTPQMTGVFTIAEAVQDSNKRPHKTVFCVLDTYDNESFSSSQKKSLDAVCKVVKDNGAKVVYSLDHVVLTLNNFKTLASMDMSKYHPVFLDTEFTDLSQLCGLISIGMTDMSGNTFYGEFTDYLKSSCSEWVQENILPTLQFNDVEVLAPQPVTNVYECKTSRQDMQPLIMKWFQRIAGGKQILMVSDCLAYDWVLFSELVRKDNGEFPSDQIFYVPVDIMGILIARGLDIDITREDLVQLGTENKHNALHDAKVIKEIWSKYL